MRVVQLHKAASPPPFGSRVVTVQWDDGATTTEHIPPTVPDSRTRQWLEKTKGKGVRAWSAAGP